VQNVQYITLHRHPAAEAVLRRRAAKRDGQWRGSTARQPAWHGPTWFHHRWQSGRAVARAPFQRVHPRRGGPNFHGPRGGGRHFEQRGRGFGGPNRQFQGGHQYQHQEVDHTSQRRGPIPDNNREPEARQEESNNRPNTDVSVSILPNNDANPNLVDISQLPASAMSLIQQLLAAMADKGKTPEVDAEKKMGEKVREGKIEVPESSAQGEARANMENNKPPYCHRCLASGHSKEECVAQLSSDFCESNTHLKTRCPVYRKAIKSYAMWLCSGWAWVLLHTSFSSTENKRSVKDCYHQGD
jgi:hypothetical protein